MPAEPSTSKKLEKFSILAFTGHHAFFTEDGREVVPHLGDILVSQDFLIEKWSKALGDPDPDIIYDRDKVIQNYNIIVALLARAEIKSLLYASDQQLNNGLREFYSRKILKEKSSRDSGTWALGALSTTNSRDAYLNECRANGVPVPDRVLDFGWKNHGELKTEFILKPEIAELWSWESENVDGLCVALPRWGKKSNKASAFGVVCLGRQTSKVCYFDNPTGQTNAANYDSFYGDRKDAGMVGYPIQKFINGFDLFDHSGGMCTDCHAGENPFIVHPKDPAFMSLTSTRVIRSKAWPDPIVHPRWYQNPYPVPNAALPNEGNCNGCHIQGNDEAGPFPILSTATPSYCGTILMQSLGRTMFPPDDPQAQYLLGMCKNDAGKSIPNLDLGISVENPPGDDRAFLSPPIVVSPLYECSQSVLIRGARFGADVDLLVNGVVVDTQRVDDVAGRTFSVPPLSSGDRIAAKQRFGNFSSRRSLGVMVRNYQEDYPQGLPQPEISRVIHECARSIAIKHIGGAALRVSKSDGTMLSGIGGPYKNTSYWVGTPIKVNDTFRVEQGFCGDFGPQSEPSTAKREPSPMPKVEISQTIDGQSIFKFKKLVGGASLRVDANAGSDLLNSWAFYSRPWNHETRLGAPFGSADSLEVSQSLCTTSEITVAPKSLGCDQLPAPRIIPPVAGENYVSVMRPVSGAWIQVYDAQGTEIGDASAPTIMLDRGLIAGESITIVRSLGEDCRGMGRLFIVKQGNGVPLKGE